jgi:hypothetical protein
MPSLVHDQGGSPFKTIASLINRVSLGNNYDHSHKNMQLYKTFPILDRATSHCDPPVKLQWLSGP